MTTPHTLLGIDFDENLASTYQYLIPAWKGFMSEWLVQHGHFPNTEEAYIAMNIGENPYGCGPTFLAKQLNFNQAWIEAFYQAVAPLAVAACRQGQLKIEDGLKENLTQLIRAGYQPIIISQAHRDYILPLLEDFGLNTLIPPSQVVDRAHKRMSPHGYQVAKYLCSDLGLQRFIMTDDSASNFPHAKAEGFHTVLIKPAPTDEERQLADQTFPTLNQYFLSLL